MENNLKNFNFWGGAIETAEALSEEDFNMVESVLEEMYPEGLSETQLNDIFWFEDDFIAEILGYDDWESFCEEKNN
jgi:hypothetical protein